MKGVRRFFCSSFLWVLLAPWLIAGAGSASNQAVLIANHDKFPVMVNAVKLEEMRPHQDKDFQGIIADIFGKPRPSPPVASATDDMLDDIHCVMTSKTHLNFLADIFDLHDAIYSIGDFGLMLGEWLQTFCPYVFLALVFRKCWEADAV